MLLRPMQCQLCGAAGADAPKLCRAFNVFAHESCLERQLVCTRELDGWVVSVLAASCFFSCTFTWSCQFAGVARCICWRRTVCVLAVAAVDRPLASRLLTRLRGS
jgi:hypothetical protein